MSVLKSPFIASIRATLLKTLQYLNKKKKKTKERTTCSSTKPQTTEAFHSFSMAFYIEIK